MQAAKISLDKMSKAHADQRENTENTLAKRKSKWKKNIYLKPFIRPTITIQLVALKTALYYCKNDIRGGILFRLCCRVFP